MGPVVREGVEVPADCGDAIVADEPGDEARESFALEEDVRIRGYDDWKTCYLHRFVIGPIRSHTLRICNDTVSDARPLEGFLGKRPGVVGGAVVHKDYLVPIHRV